jgi:putative membrane protein
MLDSSLAIALLIYECGLVRVWRTAGVRRGISVMQASAFVAGWLTVAIALSPAADAWTDKWQFAHMLQHELLMVVAAPLCAASAFLVAVAWAVPTATRPRVAAAFQRLRISRGWTMLVSPATAFIVYALALWLWHIPALYDTAMAHESVHVLEHLSFLGAATLFWWSIAHGRYGRTGYGAAVVYVFATAFQGGLLGALLTIAPRVWYSAYAIPRTSGLTALEDQQLAGLSMWIPASLGFVAGGLMLFAEWLRHSDRVTRFNPTVALKPTRVK